LSVNVRSQLSSVAKNFDTLYERTFAEALNFHLRLPNMVLGEVYMIIAKEYDSDAAANNTVAFKNSEHIEKYILAFQALNNRLNIADPLFKYERVALLIVDFSQQTPKLYNTTQELLDDNLIPVGSLANIDDLSFNGFVNDLLQIYQARFPANTFNWYFSIRKSSISCLSDKLRSNSISLSENSGTVNFSMKFFW